MEKCKRLIGNVEREKLSLRKSIRNLARLLGTADNCNRCDEYLR